MNRPNIIFVLADDMGYGDLGCYGAEKIRTPHADRIAAEGIRFTDAHSSSSVCTPSRYSVMTGRYCWRTKLKSSVLAGFGAPLIEPDRPTLPGLLKRHGYHTGMVGKWHLGLQWRRKDGRPLQYNTDDTACEGWNLDGFDVDYSRNLSGGPCDRGFDYWFGISGSLDMPPYCFIENRRTVGVPDREKHPYNPQQRKGLMVEGWRDDQCDVTFAGKAVEFINHHAATRADNPFFLYLAPSAPHRPSVPPEFLRGSSQAGPRGDAVVLVDWMVGQVLDALKKHHLDRNTLIMVSSDNGARVTDYWGRWWGHKSNGDLRGQKADIWDGGHREPLVARWPGHIKPGSVCDKLVCLSDLMATCTDVLGVELPEDSAEDSISFLPLLEDTQRGKHVRDSVIHHSGFGMFSIRKGDWKLINELGSGGFTEPCRWKAGPDDPGGQLYNLKNDLRETNNLWRQHPEIVAELTAELNTL